MWPAMNQPLSRCLRISAQITASFGSFTWFCLSQRDSLALSRDASAAPSLSGLLVLIKGSS